MKYRLATLDDIPILVRMNRQLTEDEQHRNRFKSDEWFKERMETFLILVFSNELSTAQQRRVEKLLRAFEKL